MKNKIISILIPFLLCSCSLINQKELFLPEAENDKIFTVLPSENELRISYIDVGQGDSQFIELPNGETMLIDAGLDEYGVKIVEYIKSFGYENIDYVIASHPHADHIGGLDEVIENFDIGKFYMPDVENAIPSYDDLISAVNNKGLDILTAENGVTVLEEENLSVKILSPVLDSYEDMNDYSTVIKINYMDNSFLFTADAETAAENALDADIDCDVLKIGHHGSSSSSSSSFIDKVSPSIAIISCGKNNDYGHPSKEVTDRLDYRGIKYYRTDELGTITVVSDGVNISVDTEKTEAENVNSENYEIIYVLNTRSLKIHYDYCESVPKISERNIGYTNDYSEAISQGYEPCGVCRP